MTQAVVIQRHSAPTKYDQHEYGTICEVHEDNKKLIYVQFSNDIEEPKWELMSEEVK